jgi:hypothetical protein
MDKMKILREAISNILEEMYFLIEETPPDKIEEKYHFLTVIDDPFFVIRIFMSRELAHEITTNFLGSGEPPSDEDVLDCLQEILNMVTGNFIGQVYPGHQSLLPFPACRLHQPGDDVEKEAQTELLFYHNQPLKISFREL